MVNKGQISIQLGGRTLTSTLVLYLGLGVYLLE